MTIPIVHKAHLHADRVAFLSSGTPSSYHELLHASKSLAASLLDRETDLEEQRVALLVGPGVPFAAAQWGVWIAGGIALPLSLSATESEWRYTLTDAQVSILIVSREWREKIRTMSDLTGIRILVLEDGLKAPKTVARLPTIDLSRRALILYTSGTTSKPKGVVTTHQTITSQIESLVQAWRWSESDRIPLFLPLHHIHGLINIMSCALWSGAQIEPFARLEIDTILRRVAAKSYTLFMAVPTIYVKLIDAIQALEPEQRDAVVEGFRSMRLMVSGSAALPETVFSAWFQITGQKLLERYGMTEIGMAISNPYDHPRLPGTVGKPLPGVDIRLVSESNQLVEQERVPGEIQVRGPTVFQAYWNRPEATSASFDGEWFRTGDIAEVKDGYYRILGRQSVDIIKSGGYKLSALEIESALLDHPQIAECAIVGVEDPLWGESVAAAIVLKNPSEFSCEALREWCRNRVSVYKIPKHFLVLDQLPRNAMGKVNKPLVKGLFSK
jgi:malonyl-CoA/methylmalonyl-CoA synthetase